jgi:microcystin-dependent protein
MADAFIGEIRAFPYTFPPLGWFYCNGQTIAVSQAQALCAIVGGLWGFLTTTTFTLPNLQNNVLPGAGQGVGAASVGVIQYRLAQTMGTASVTLDPSQVPTHNHVASFGVNNAPPTYPAMTANATTNVSQPYRMVKLGTGTSQALTPNNYSSDAPNTTLTQDAISIVGGVVVNNVHVTQPHENRQPYQGMKFCINNDGTFPMRN